jgi:hypothetical protein
MLYNDIRDINVDLIILYADPNLPVDFMFVDNKYLIIRTYDTYDYLINKTFFLFSILNKYTNYEGVFKCDDDVILNKNVFQKILKNKMNDYVGKKVRINIKNNVYYYAGGPIYYISKKCLELFTYENIMDLFKTFKIKKGDPEDTMVGLFLEVYGNIKLSIFDLYSDYINELNEHSFIHDVERKIVLKI